MYIPTQIYTYMYNMNIHTPKYTYNIMHVLFIHTYIYVPTCTCTITYMYLNVCNNKEVHKTQEDVGMAVANKVHKQGLQYHALFHITVTAALANGK